MSIQQRQYTIQTKDYMGETSQRGNITWKQVVDQIKHDFDLEDLDAITITAAIEELTALPIGQTMRTETEEYSMTITRCEDVAVGDGQ